jgi:hypothetical protein
MIGTGRRVDAEIVLLRVAPEKGEMESSVKQSGAAGGG